MHCGPGWVPGADPWHLPRRFFPTPVSSTSPDNRQWPVGRGDSCGSAPNGRTRFLVMSPWQPSPIIEARPLCAFPGGTGLPGFGIKFCKKRVRIGPDQHLLLENAGLLNSFSSSRATRQSTSVPVQSATDMMTNPRNILSLERNQTYEKNPNVVVNRAEYHGRCAIRGLAARALPRPAWVGVYLRYGL